jgi:type III pantothenate kinase
LKKNFHSLKLAIDIGNTSTGLALFEGKHLFAISKINECILKGIQEFVANQKISAAIISSVKEINPEILSVLDYYKGFIFAQNLLLPITNNYKTPNTLGRDRLAAVVGAHSLYPKKDIIVLDAGTCLTIDFVSAKGEYIGGKISPGIEMRYKALHTFTDKLPLVSKEKVTPIIGDDTTSSILSGVQRGILAEVRSIISEYRLQKPNAVAVITGGDSFFFEKELKNSIFANPNLVMIGLNEILDFNA